MDPPHNVEWWEHSPCPVLENYHISLFWNITIQTNKSIRRNRPCITFKICGEMPHQPIDRNFPMDIKVSGKTYQNLSNDKQLHGFALYNVISQRNWSRKKPRTFKRRLVKFLQEIPDQPPSPGYVSKNNNSQLESFLVSRNN